ncbi:MAG: hypothetical protein AAFO62_06280, partial [Pseudomonadota bacterium]
SRLGKVVKLPLTFCVRRDGEAQPSMTEAQSTARIATPSASSSAVSPPIAFRDGIDIVYGPRPLLGRYFLAAEAHLAGHGLKLTFEPLETLVAINEANRDTWIPLLPLFNPAYGIPDGDGFCLIARDASGAVMATQAGRFFGWAHTNFRDEAESLRLFYADPGAQAKPGERCRVTIPDAERITGRVVFSGGVWCHPNVRGTGLTGILPRISRAHALSRWATDLTMTFFAEGVAKGGVARRAGYTDVAYDVIFENNHLEGVKVGLATMRTADLIDDLTGALERFDTAEVDPVFHRRAG